MKLAHIVTIRDKAAHVEKCARAVLAQTMPIHAVFSDQGSTDGSLDIVKRIRDEYSGPHDILILEGAPTERRGMAGLVAHLNYVHENLPDGVEYVSMTSADDFDEPTRDERVMAAFEKHDPDFVGVRSMIAKPGYGPHAESFFPDRYSRWIAVGEAIRYGILSACSASWSVELWKRLAPLRGVESADFTVPMMALFGKGFYYIDEPLHTYVEHADANNTGVEGVLRAALAANDPDEVRRINEINEFHNCYNWTALWRRLSESGYIGRMSSDANQALTDRIFNRALGWAVVRESMILDRIEPRNMLA